MSRRVVFTAIGEPTDVVQVVEHDPGRPGPTDVRVQVELAAINPADFLRFRGKLGPAPAAFPAPAGSEGSGRVVECGAAVTGVAVGDRVLVPSGLAWADAIVCAADAVIVVPSDLDPRQAAMLSINPATAALLLDTVKLADGDWIIYNAASSAVGRLVTRLAASRRLRTVALVRRPEATAELRALGATVALVDGDDVAARVAQATEGAPIRLALDAIAGRAAGRLVDCLAPGATLVVYGVLDGDRLELSATRVAFQGVRVRGFSRLGEIANLGPIVTPLFYERLALEVAMGALTTEVDAVYPLADVQAALRHAERPDRRGKVLLAMTV